MTLTSQLWKLLDEATDRFMGIPKEERQTPAALKAAGEARGLSNAIHVMCQPHYEDGTAVAKLAIKRMKARQAGEDMPPTPGDMDEAESAEAIKTKHEETKAKATNAKKAEPKQAAPGAGPAAEQAGATTTDLDEELASLSEQQTKQIKNGLRCGFEAGKLAELYKVSVAAIERVGTAD